MVLQQKNTYIFNIIFVVNVGMMREKTEKEILFPLMPYLIIASVSLFLSLRIYLLILSIMWYLFMLGTNNGIIGAVFIGSGTL